MCIDIEVYGIRSCVYCIELNFLISLQPHPNTYIDFHLAIKAVVKEQVVSHSDSVRLHGVSLAIIVVSYIACTEKNQRTCLEHKRHWHVI